MNEKALAYGVSISVLCLVIALIPVSAQLSANGFGLEDASGVPGTHVIVPVNITNAKNGPVQGIVFNIAYDKRVISVTNVLRGELTSDWNVLGLNNDFEGGGLVFHSRDLSHMPYQMAQVVQLLCSTLAWKELLIR